MIQEIMIHDVAGLIKYIDGFPNTRILVVGDIIMDEYIWGNVSRISPEAPVPIVQVIKETQMLGGAANAINNINSLGGKSMLCGVIGDDPKGREILNFIQDLGIIHDGIIIEDSRPTSIKTRIVAHNQQVVRVDREIIEEIKSESIKKILGFIKKHLNDLDGIIVSDYGKGVISSRLMKGLREIVKNSDIILAVDPKTDNFKYYKEVDTITPNHHEAGAYCGIEIDNEENLLRAGNLMLNNLKCRSVLITQGKDGMTLFQRDEEPCHIPTVSRKVFDVSGAGDTVISTLSLCLASGMDLKSAAIVSNFAAGIVVGEVGTSTVSSEELKKVINGHYYFAGYESKAGSR